MDSKSPEEKLGEKIKERRKALKMSQDKLGKAVGLIQGKISQIEIGKRRLDMLTELPKFAEALGMPVHWFMTEEEVPTSEVSFVSFVKMKCPSLGELSPDDINYLMDLCGDIMTPVLERDARFSKKINRT